MLHASAKLSCDTEKDCLLKLLSGFKIFWLGMTTNERLNMSRYHHFTDNYGAMQTPFRLVESFLGFSLTQVAWTFSQIYYVWPTDRCCSERYEWIEGESEFLKTNAVLIGAPSETLGQLIETGWRSHGQNRDLGLRGCYWRDPLWRKTGKAVAVTQLATVNYVTKQIILSSLRTIFFNSDICIGAS